MNYTRALARISKDKISRILAPFETEVEVVKRAKNNDELFNRLQEEGLLDKFDIEDHSDVDYSFIHTFNGVATDKFNIRLPKSAIKQYLYLHFIPANKSNIRKNTSLVEIAETLNVSYTTVKTNFDLLVKVGLVWLHKNGKNSYDVTIVDEYKMHEKNGRGYITLSANDLYDLCSFENVNELRIELKKYLWVDAKSKMAYDVKFNKANLLKELPMYLNMKQKELLLNASNSKFKFNGKDLDTSNFKDSADIRNMYSDMIRLDILNFFTDNNITYICKNVRANTFGLCLPERELVLQDMVGLALQYSLGMVKEALKCVKERITEIGFNDIINIGAFLRSKIENELLLA